MLPVNFHSTTFAARMKRDIYPTDKTISELLPQFYARYNLSNDGGQSKDRVRLEFGKHFSFYIPNWDARRRGVLMHDAHHIITSYPSEIIGETEIGAWEVSSGCKHFWAGWLLNMQSFSLGIWINPLGIFKAFVRGRRSKNLYDFNLSEVEILQMTVGELQHKLHLPSCEEKLQASVADYVSFFFWLSLSSLVALLSLGLLPAILIYNLYLLLIPQPSR